VSAQSSGRRPDHRRGLIAGSLFLVLLGIWLATAAAAEARPFLKGTAEPLYTSGDNATRDRWFDETVNAGGNLVRLNVQWRSAVSGEPADPTNPADPAYNFGPWDTAVREASSRGLRVLLTVYGAPDFAEAKNQPENPGPLTPEGSFRPNPEALGDFAQALARRYSGGFSDGLVEGPLPRVDYFEAWNEPNLSVHLYPQWNKSGTNNQAAPHYRRMLNAFYEGVKASGSGAQVVTGGLGPFGSDPDDNLLRTRPLLFLREVLCLKQSRKLRPDKCKEPPKFDILAHHPINVHGGPRRSAVHPDDAGGAVDFKNVARILRFAERKNTVPGKHGLWGTEFWWQTNPPDPDFGYSLAKQASYIQETFYLMWKYGASAGIILQMVDQPYRRENNGLQTGLFFVDGSRKPAFQAFRFPFVTDRKSRGKLVVWTIPPSSGELLVEEKRGSGWETVASGNAQAGQVLTDKLRLRGRTTLRATVGGEQSLAWTEGKGGKGGKGYSADGRARGSAPAAPEISEPGFAPDPVAPVPESLSPYVESLPAP
jgi:hypothetical protein